MRELADRLTSVLDLTFPPVALRFTTTAPADVPPPARPLPSACAMWREAERRTFYAPAGDHHGCPVGTMVMGFPVDEVGDRLGEVVTAMAACGYLSPEEAAAIPSVGRASSGIVYGPLADAGDTPDVVLLWVNAKQAMLLTEADGTAAWTAPPATVSGRPGCTALPLALQGGRPATSLGCIGMRTFTGIPDHLMLVAVPGAALRGFTDDVERLAAANDSMLALYSAMTP
ncbi:DUF169 domain-containing protein [Saccharothrix syringae]|uniref:DUF169 domain-containing protein n=1 Tax=Saccharothrix syringae TaxID=103733 RepID=A0A5Q0H2W8_SACSY|nr:DUF169 domain-containing protein [Saccharothrix syringae]QFZ20170.1 hypothetical protein EKG83_24620 [Saccharothrix syringae]